MHSTAVYIGEALACYGFGEGHPFGPDRLGSFWDEAVARGLDRRVDVLEPVSCTVEDLVLFHGSEYVERVRTLSKSGFGFLDYGDTPAFPGVFEAASTVVGSVLDAVARLVSGEYRHVFIPIAGLHHCRRDMAAGFCAFNDCGVAIEALRARFGVRRVAYVDIDAHHGDGVFYSFENDPDLCFIDFHQDGRTLYPGTGAVEETGKGDAAGTKLNIPMPAGASDDDFFRVWPQAESFLAKAEPEFILFQCGADSVRGDPITAMAYSEKAHAHAAARLRILADRCCNGRLLAMGGGGYNRDNLARAWSEVVSALI